MAYRKITVLSDSIFEVKTYDRLNLSPGGDTSEIEKGTGAIKDANYRERQRIRRTMVRQLVTCNFTNHSKFITLTFRENLIDVKKANYIFMKFIQRLKYWHDGKSFNYLAVIEFQKRGAVHYHMIADLDFVPANVLRDLWKNGFVKINDITNVDNVGAYVVKYMSKNTDDKRLQGLKGYNCSRGLARPVVLKSWSDSDYQAVIDLSIELQKKSPVYSSQYMSEDGGVVLYQQYNLSRTPEFQQQLLFKMAVKEHFKKCE